MKLLKEMLREEWRMHATVFGGYRFALFPFLVFAVAAGIVAAFPSMGVGPGGVLLGMHFLVLFFGLNVGGIGFISRSGMRNVLGEMNLLLYSSRTLPLSTRDILAAFVVKDLLYYLVYFILPVAAGSVVLAPSAVELALLTVSYTFAFLLGVSATFAISTLYVRARRLLLAGGVAAAATVLFLDLPLTVFNPAYAFYTEPTPVRAGLALLPAAALIAIGAAGFGRATRSGPTTVTDRFSGLDTYLGPLEAKNLLDIHRSSGSFGKILLSFVVLGGVFWFLIAVLPFGSAYLRAPLLSFAALLGIASVAIYNWLNRFDDPDGYMHLPVDTAVLLRGKVRSHALIGLPLVALADILAFLALRPVPAQLLHALLISTAAGAYVLAVTVRLTGLDPNRMLFDTWVLARFLVAASLLIVPLLVATLLYPAAPATVGPVLLGIDAIGLIAAAILLRPHLSAGASGRA